MRRAVLCVAVCARVITRQCMALLEYVRKSNAFVVLLTRVELVLQEEVLRFDEVENVKMDLVATKGIAYIKFRTASSALRAKEDIEKHNVVRLHCDIVAVCGCCERNQWCLRCCLRLSHNAVCYTVPIRARHADRRQACGGARSGAQDASRLLHAHGLSFGQPPWQRLWQCAPVAT